MSAANKNTEPEAKKTKTQDNLEKMLTGFLTRLGKIENFVLAEAPDFVKDIVKVEYVKMQNGMIESSIWLTICSLIVGTYIRSYGLNFEEDFSSGQVLWSIVTVLATLLGSLAFGSLVNEALKYREMKASEKLVALNGISKILKGKF